jgi:AI-2 transport system ATP-binding protein
MAIQPENPSRGDVAVALHDIWKVFAGVPVLKGIDFELRAGEIQALLGGNGSGKSTTVKILCGAYQPTAGTIEMNGQVVQFDRPSEAHRHGIYMVPQEPHIFPHLTVEENLLLGDGIDPDGALEKARRLAKETGFEADFSSPGGFLSIANQQLVEILRGLLRDAKVLIFDEPTSALTVREVESLFQHMQRLKARGIAILFISHRLNEVLEISDRVSVLRDGSFVLSAPTATLTAGKLVEAMLPGAAAGNAASPAPSDPKAAARPTVTRSGTPVLEVNGLNGDMFQDVSLKVWPGEVVGLAGLVGAGRTELAEAILGLDKEVHGEVRIAGQPVNNRTPRACQERGLCYVPEDRHAHGIFLELPHPSTTSASVLGTLGRFFLWPGRERALSDRFVGEFDIRTSSRAQLSGQLSGGNQQKIVLSKTLAAEPKIIILDEPTRGIDARARLDVYRIIRDLTARGVAVLLISSELGEIVDLSDRVLVMYRGRVEELSARKIGLDEVSAASFGLQHGATP